VSTARVTFGSATLAGVLALAACGAPHVAPVTPVPVASAKAPVAPAPAAAPAFVPAPSFVVSSSAPPGTAIRWHDCSWVTLARGGSLALQGDWTARTEMWPDAALVFNGSGGALILEGGARSPRRLRDGAGALSDPAWSSDGRTLLAWRGDELQHLTATDTVTGDARKLVTLDTHIWHSEGLDHVDPVPVDRALGIVEDPDFGRLLVLFDEESNDEVNFWQRREGRGGTSLLGVGGAGATLTALIARGVLPPVIFSWDVSLQRRRLFLIGREQGRYRPDEERSIQERDLAGTLLRVFPEPKGGAEELLLSPDERWLLVERRFKPLSVIPEGDLDDLELPQLEAVNEAADGGFVLIDLATGAQVNGPGSGCEAAWSPDGTRIAYATRMGVSLWDVATGGERWLVRKPVGAPPMTCIDLEWSPDGRRLAISTWERGFWIALDLVANECFVCEGYAKHKLWSRDPRPFGG
jgi:hypothetical protein